MDDQEFKFTDICVKKWTHGANSTELKGTVDKRGCYMGGNTWAVEGWVRTKKSLVRNIPICAGPDKDGFVIVKL